MSVQTLDSYISERVRKLEPTRTTTTASGQVLDWIARKGQAPATAPPDARLPKASDPKSVIAKFELDDDAAERGPDGSVPILRPRSSGKPEDTEAAC